MGSHAPLREVTWNGRDNTTSCWRFLNKCFLKLIKLSRTAETRWRRQRHVTVRNDAVNAGSLRIHFRHQPMPRDQPHCWPMFIGYWLTDETQLNWIELNWGRNWSLTVRRPTSRMECQRAYIGCWTKNALSGSEHSWLKVDRGRMLSRRACAAAAADINVELIWQR